MFGDIEQALGLAATALVALGLRALFLYFKPYRPCRWCRPGGVLGGGVPGSLAASAGRKPKRKRKRRCWRCKNTKITRRWGAWHVHKAKLSLGQAWAERGDE